MSMFPAVHELDKKVVVVGGSLGGLAVTHRLLKQARRRHPEMRVVLVSQNSHFYWNIASVRAVVPGALRRRRRRRRSQQQQQQSGGGGGSSGGGGDGGDGDGDGDDGDGIDVDDVDDILHPIEPELIHRYPRGSVEFVTGRAIRLDAADKTVSVETPTYGIRLVHYTHLVLATGASAAVAGMPWKASGSYEDLLGDMRATARLVARARHVTVAGGGPTGVELAAEIKAAYGPRKAVLLLHSAPRLLSSNNDGGGGDDDDDNHRTAATTVADQAERELRALGVELHKGARATNVNREARDDGTIVVTLSDGGSFETDAYLPTTGLIPNTRWIPKALLTDRGYLDVDDCMRVRGVDSVWAVGDVVSKPDAGLLNTEAHVRTPPLLLMSPQPKNNE
ncbi:hypothetical protein JDV02_007621 [Purpureocillium takamizusanense]|uniref:FAD/NAD(P)-binding domain-containing protein n=1 Tax=Purpureocillium takamizusanense TaxID=2060973 RepID=A0A9Q8VE87_9HYPO|nr:uncharacterized protein JDV02_007621 [Purpureocillium takamizusanense]UNI21649.1 hypothetical protein JDV02_007621 [Purpureocillium takamizusanense]